MRFFFLALIAVASTANAVVIRHDVDDARYRTDASELPALADLPGEGHGVLIAPRWVLTAAHAVTWQDAVDRVIVGGVARPVKRLVIHAGYRKLPEVLIAEALKSGDATRISAHLASSDDIALVELDAPVEDVPPVVIYRGHDELNSVAKIVGRGATGTGDHGHEPGGPNRTHLRRAFNRIVFAEGRWLGYVFDEPRSALALEGMAGNGDSGGALLVEVDGQWQLAGLAAWKRGPDDALVLRPGAYGQTSYNVRVGHYRQWIDEVITAVGYRDQGAARQGTSGQEEDRQW